ncbi:MAG: hypothetical protein J3R72DRAFT_498792 [Linnemannia gamsii]|nr:MAG: hypothetical protein J3R72DRAFT_498792 [Linnemannia gamsii]
MTRDSSEYDHVEGSESEPEELGDDKDDEREDVDTFTNGIIHINTAVMMNDGSKSLQADERLLIETMPPKNTKGESTRSGRATAASMMSEQETATTAHEESRPEEALVVSSDDVDMEVDQEEEGVRPSNAVVPTIESALQIANDWLKKLDSLNSMVLSFEIKHMG